MKRLRRLSGRRSSRRSEARYLLDGPVLLAEALECGARIEGVYAEPGAPADLLEAVTARGVPLQAVAQGALRKVLDLAAPQAVVAVVAMEPVGFEELCAGAIGSGAPLLALVGIQDPGNAGTLVRVAEAAGCAGVAFTEGSVDPWNPKAVRASAGSVLRVPLAVDVPVGELLGATRDRGLDAVATVTEGGRPPELTELAGASVLLVGSEAHGLPEELLAVVTRRVAIPMAGRVESLNAAVSGALVAFEAARQRRGAEPVRPEGGSVGQNARGDLRPTAENT